MFGIFLSLTMKSKDLDPKAYNSYYQTYIDKVGDASLLPMMEKQMGNFPNFMASIPEEKMNHTYGEGKWTIAEVLQHIIDAERIFQYRALRFARNDKTPLSGFDENAYVPESYVIGKSKKTLIEEYKTTRAASLSLFKSFDESVLARTGVASNSPMSVGALGFIICGHQRHHRDVIRERYL